MTFANEFTNKLPPMMSGQELICALEVLPHYDSDICYAENTSRLMALSDIYNIYIPSAMSVEIYSKLYLALLRSLQKRERKLVIQQQIQNHRAVMGQEYSGIMGGADSFTIIGVSGIGKSAAISRAMSVISENVIIEMQDPYSQIIPFVTVQCPFDSSVKGMLLEILRKIDEVLDTKYYQNALRARATTDMLIGSVSQAALHHVGMLVVDEIQNIVTNKNGKSLIGSLTQLINNTGISVCMVGTPESSRFFGLAMQLARRSVGLQYSTMSYDDHFKLFCKTILGYQYLRKRIEVNDGILEWLYEHSSGVTSVVVALLHDAQEIAILNGVEELILPVLNEAYDKRLALLHGYIQPDITPLPQTSKCRKVQQKVFLKNETVQNEEFHISDTVKNVQVFFCL